MYNNSEISNHMLNLSEIKQGC